MSVNYDSKKFYNIGYRPPSETQDRQFYGKSEYVIRFPQAKLDHLSSKGN